MRPASGPGRHVGSGSLRVDAGRAIAKLREYQLADPSHWILEIVRGAVASEARWIGLRWDADDLVLTWEGEPLDPARALTLLDALISPGSRRADRLLAMGLNTALGVGTRWVDVIALDTNGGARRVRYRPTLLESGESSALEQLELEPIERPTEARGSGGMIALKRSLGRSVATFFSLQEPAEVRALRERAGDLRVPLELGAGARALGADAPVDLLRIELGLGLNGFLALTREPLGDGIRVELAEQGVGIIRRAVPFSEELPLRRTPLRLFLNAERMPTNASRSDVRMDEAPIPDAIERGRELLHTLSGALVEALGQADASGDAARAEALRRAAMQLMASAVAGREWAVHVAAGRYPPALAPLMEAELLIDALGRARSAASFGPENAGSAHVGTEPLEASLAQALGDVLWLRPGDPAALLFGDAGPMDSGPLLLQAAAQLAARERFLSHPPQPLGVEEAQGQWLAMPLGAAPALSAIPADWPIPEGLEGEFVLLEGRGEGELRFMHESREIERAAQRSLLRFVASVHVPGLRPRQDYRSLQRDEPYLGTHRAAQVAAIRAAEALVRAVFEGELLGEASVRDPRLARLLGRIDPGAIPSSEPLLEVDALRGDAARIGRHALVSALWTLRQRFFDTERAPDEGGSARSLRSSGSPLLDLPIFPYLRGDSEPLRWIAFAQIGSLPSAGLGAEGPSGPPTLMVGHLESIPRWRSGHALLLLEASLIEAMGALLDDVATLVPYMPRPPLYGQGDPARELARRFLPLGGVSLASRGQAWRGAVCWGSARPRLSWMHQGHLIFDEPSPGDALTLVVDDDDAIPAPDWRSFVLGTTRTHHFEARGWALARAVIDAMVGERNPDLIHQGETLDAASPVAQMLLHYLASVEDLGACLGDEARRERLWGLPLITLLGRGASSLAQVEEVFPGKRILTLRPGVAIGEDETFEAVVCTEALGQAIAGLLGRSAADGRARLEQARRQRAKTARKAAILAKPVVALEDLLPDPKLRFDHAHLEGWIALPAAPIGETALHLHLEGRPISLQLDPKGLPLVAAVNVSPELLDESFEEMSESQLRRVRGQLIGPAGELLMLLAERSPERLLEGPGVALLSAFAQGARSKRQQARRHELFAKKIFLSLEGKRISLEGATHRGRVRVAQHEGGWLGPEPGDRQHRLDRGAIALPSQQEARDPLLALIEIMSEVAELRGAPIDESAEAQRLQGRRRVSQGKVAKPTLATVDGRIKRDLGTLLEGQGSLWDRMGPGEVALVAPPLRGAVLSLHRNGVPVGQQEFDLAPALRMTLESGPMAARLEKNLNRARSGLVRDLKLILSLLAESILAQTPMDERPPWLRRALRAALLQGEDWKPLEREPLFETSCGRWVAHPTLLEQTTRFESVWWIEDLERGDRALDAQRLVFRLSREEARLLSGSAPMLEASRELGLDAIARRNAERPALQSLQLSDETRRSCLCVASLEGDGQSAGRGLVAPLHPGAIQGRGVQVLREMRPLGPMKDVCSWPTAALVDHAGLRPNRLHDGPAEDPAWSELAERVARVSAEALDALIEAPAEALIHSSVQEDRAQEVLRGGRHALGSLWLGELEGAGVEVLSETGTQLLHLQGPGRGPLPLAGRLIAILGKGFAERILVDLLRAHYRELVQRLAERVGATLERGETPSAAAFSHVAIAAAAGEIQDRSTLDGLLLPCFAPPQNLRQLVGLIETRAPVPIVRDARSARSGEVALIDDGTALPALLGSMLRAHAVLGGGGTGAPAAMPGMASLAFEIERRIHRLGLGASLSGVRIAAARKAPLIVFDRAYRALTLASRSPVLRALEEGYRAGKPQAEAAIDILVSHAAGVLNRAHGSVTDGAEIGASLHLLRDAGEPRP